MATQRRLVQASVFSRDELILLNRYATPMDRVFLLLGLNCAFGVAEIASLTVGELCLGQAHSQREQELLRFETTDQDSFIKRIRRKSGVYGEFILFPQTVQAVQWALSVRRRQADFHPDAILLLNGSGEWFDRPTSSGNRNQQIPNRFAALRRRIGKDGHEISNLSFGKLRKTSADLIRQFSDGEVAGVFLCHGKPVATDHLSEVYTNRPFGKVFAAIRNVEEHLQPVFEAAGAEPFPSGSNRCIPTIERHRMYLHVVRYVERAHSSVDDNVRSNLPVTSCVWLRRPATTAERVTPVTSTREHHPAMRA